MSPIRRLIALWPLALVLALSLGLSAAAQVNPTELSVNEEALLEALREGEVVEGRATIPDPAAGALIKPGGRDWTAFHRGTMLRTTAWAVLGMLAVLAVFYLVRGRIRIDSGRAGRTITRFGGLERFAHWLTAACFILLALSGLNLVFGRYVLLPLIGEGAFGTLTQWGKFTHNFLAWPFMLGLVLIFLLWVRDNLPTRLDGQWLARGGGFFSRGVHIPARKFNAGQKLMFWLVILGGAALSVTGFMLIFPQEAGGPADWQFYQMVHGLVAAIMIAAILAHIYIGTLGMEGAFSAMGTGAVDLSWAREHHALWVEEKLAREAGREPAEGSRRRPVAPAE